MPFFALKIPNTYLISIPVFGIGLNTGIPEFGIGIGIPSCDSIFVSGAKEIHKQQKLWQHDDYEGWGPECGNLIIFLSLRFYVKSILENVAILKLLFSPF